MKGKLSFSSILSILAHILVLIITFSLLIGSIGFQRDGPTTDSVDYINEVSVCVDGGTWEQVSLPHTFHGLKARTPVSVKVTIYPDADDCVYIKSVYSPAKVFLNGTEVFSFGKKENYPDFMIDPATELHIIETYGSGDAMELKIDFLSPKARDTLTIHPPILGTSKALIMERSRTLGIPLIFSLLQLVGGFAMILVALCIVIVDRKAMAFFWLGLFSMSTGAWSFGENNFTSVIFRDSTFLYLLSFIGLFTFIIPLIHFVRLMVDFSRPKLLWGLELFFCFSAGLALFLQLQGIVSLSASMYLFHVMLPLALVLMLGLTVYEFVFSRNVGARRLILPLAILTLTAVVELFNYQFPFTYLFSSLFQVGILFFLLIMGVLAGLNIKDSIALQNREKELSFEENILNMQAEEEKKARLLLAQHEQLISQQRHDLRHHLTAIQSMVSEENTDLQAYLDTLMEQIPPAKERFCRNNVVNAIMAHYDTICQRQGIRFTAKLDVPEVTEKAANSNLCVIFANLLENAVEACARMKEGPRFITINSTTQFDLLTITMDNSFNGDFRIENGRFRSAKRNDFGIGISSIRSVAQKSGGDAEFRTEGKVFFSSVFLQL